MPLPVLSDSEPSPAAQVVLPALLIGATFRIVPLGEDAITSTIVAFGPPRLLTDLAEFEGLAIRVEHRLDPRADGSTTISYAVTVTGEAPDEVCAEVGGQQPTRSMLSSVQQTRTYK